MDTIDCLKNNDLFKGLEISEIKLIAERTTTKTVKKDTLIISEGDISSVMYLIKQGKVNVTVNNDKGKEMILTTLQAGDIFGELSLLDDKPRSANVVTLEKCVLIVLHKADFFELMAQHPKIAIQVIKYLCQMVRFTDSIVQSLALMDVYERLRKFLYDRAAPRSDGTLAVTAPLTHKEIASHTGSGREMISRILSELQKGQYLTVENKIITINRKLPSAR